MLPFNFHLTTPLFCLLALLLFLHHVSSTALPKPEIYIVPGDLTFPEGIARQPDSQDFYVSSATTGDIFRGNVYETKLSPFINGSLYGLTNATGMKVTASGRLFVAGGFSGTVFVFDVKFEKLLHKFSNGVNNRTLVNDLDIADDGTVYATDTFLAVVYRITPEELESPEVDLPLRPWADLSGAVGYGWSGIVVTPGDRVLLIANIYTGEIWRIEVETRAVTKVDLGAGAAIGAPEGLLFRGKYLYSVSALNSSAQFVQVIYIPPPYGVGTPVRRIGSTLFERPSTAAFDGGDLMVVNFQFSNSTPPPPVVLPFTVVRVHIYLDIEEL